MKNYFVFSAHCCGKEVHAEDLAVCLSSNPNFKISVKPVQVFSCHSYPEKCFLAEAEAIGSKKPEVLIRSFNATLEAVVCSGNAQCLNYGHLGAYRAVFRNVREAKVLQDALNVLIHTAPFLLTVAVEENTDDEKDYVGYVFFDCVDRAQKLEFYLRKYVQFGDFLPVKDIVSF